MECCRQSIYGGIIFFIGILIAGCAGEFTTYRFLKDGQTAYTAAEYPAAIKQWQRGLQETRRSGNKQEMGMFLFNLGLAYDGLSQYQEALNSYQEALAIRRELGDTRREGFTLNNLGIVYHKLGQYQEALEYYQQALEIWQHSKNKAGEGQNLNNLGTVHLHLGAYQTALEHYQQALTIRRELKDQQGEANTLNNTGAVYWSLGQYQEASDHYHLALTIRQNLGDRAGISKSLNNIGAVYWNLGQYYKALSYYQDALAITREMKDKSGEASNSNNIGLTYWKMDQFDEARQYYRQALTIRHEIGDKRGEASTRNSLGAILADQGNSQQALEYYQQALALRQEISDLAGIGLTLSYLGRTYRALEQYEEASQAFHESLEINRRLGTKKTLWLAQSGLAAVEAQLGQSKAAVMHYEQALTTIEDLRTGLTEKEDKESFLRDRDKLSVYDDLLRLLSTLHQQHPDQGYDRKALEIFERKQGRIFLEEIGKSGARLFAGLPEIIKEREEQLETQLAHVRQTLADARTNARPQPSRVQTLKKQLRQLQAEYTALREKIKTEYPDYYDLRYPRPVSFAELRTSVLHPNDVMFVYNVMDESTFLWVIRPTTMQLYILPADTQTLQTKISTIREAMTNDWLGTRGLNLGKKKKSSEKPPEKSPSEESPFAQLSYELYSLLFPEEVRGLLSTPHALHIVLSGPLYALPFEALITTPPDTQARHYLIQDIPVNYLSSASLLKTLREAKTRRRATARDPFLAFAHPTYTLDNAQNTSTLDSLQKQAYLELLAGGLAELPETAEEAQTIASLWSTDETTTSLHLRQNASHANVFEMNADDRLEQYQYLLFAMHGVIPGEVNRLNQSALILSDGFLTTADVFRLNLNAELIALSACNTGMGDHIQGEGVIGLTRAFMYAGTPAIAVTLWSVESLSAKALSIGMFRAVQQGEPPALALRSSKLRMLQGEEGQQYQTPYYWAPYVIFGDGW